MSLIMPIFTIYIPSLVTVDPGGVTVVVFLSQRGGVRFYIKTI